MDFVHLDLGYLAGGESVELQIDQECNVLLLDDDNLALYVKGEIPHGGGGHTTSKLVELQVPVAGHWHVVADLGGENGTITISATVDSHARG